MPFPGTIPASCSNPGATTVVPYQEGWIDFPGTIGNYATVPDAAALRIPGDICIVARVTADDWTPTAVKTIVGKRAGGTTNSYRLLLTVAGTLQLAWSPTGLDAAQLLATSTSPVGAVDGALQWVAVAIDVDNGAAGRSTRFWLSANGTTWTQLGGTVTVAGVTSIFAGAGAALEIGSSTVGTQLLWAGNVRHISIRNGIGPTGTVGGTEVFRFAADPDLIGVAPTAPTVPASSGQTMAVNRSASDPKTVIVPTLRQVCEITLAQRRGCSRRGIDANPVTGTVPFDPACNLERVC